MSATIDSKLKPASISIWALICHLGQWLGKHLGWSLGGIIILLVFSILDFIPPFLYREIFDVALPEHDLEYLKLLFLLLIIAVLLQILLVSIRSRLFGRLSAAIATELRTKLLEQTHSVELSSPKISRHAEFLNLFGTHVDTIEALVLVTFPRVTQGIIYIVFGLTLMFVLNWQLAVLTLAIAPLGGIGSWVLGGKTRQAQKQKTDTQADVLVQTDTIVRGQRSIRAYGLKNWWLERFSRQLSQAEQSASKAGTLTVGLQGATLMTAVAISIMVLISASGFIFLGWLTVGGFMAFLSLVMVAINGLNKISDSIPDIVQAQESFRCLEEIFAIPTIETQGDDAPELTKEIRFENISFAYNPQQWAVKDVSLSIKAGTSVALVGTSGSGKSTLLNMLLGFNQPQKGKLCWDGNSFDDFSLNSLRLRMAVVFQETDIFALTMRENIRLGRVEATDEEVEQAARDAELHEIIQALPSGYDTLLGDGETGLSGGQIQRLAIARALLRKPEILLLDEVTSALDPRTEAAVNQTLSRLTQGRTVISVTHKLDWASRADYIYVLQEGSKVEQGTHQELLTLDGIYAKLYHCQQGIHIKGGLPQVTPELLAQIPLFAPLPEQVRNALVSLFIVERRFANEVVIREKEAGERFYVVGWGELSVEISTADKKTVGVLRQGDVFGEIALLMDTLRTATVTARHESLLLSLNREDFLELINDYPEAREIVTNEAKRRLEAN